MRTKEPNDSYHKLSAKALQELCQKYGLPPCKTRSKSVHSLASYFEKNSNSISPTRSPRIHSSLGTPQQLSGTQSRDMADAGNDVHGITPCSRKENLREMHSQTVKINELGSCEGTNGDNKALYVQTSDDLENIQKPHRLLSHIREMCFQKLRKSPRLSGYNGEMDLQTIFQCSENEIKCRVDSQMKGPDRNNLYFPIEDDMANMAQVRKRSTGHDGEKDLQNLRQSPRLSGKNMQMNFLNIFECSQKGIKSRGTSQEKGLSRNNFSSSIEAELANKPQVHNRKAKYDRNMDLQNIRRSPRLLGKNGEANVQTIHECREMGVKCRAVSKEESPGRNNMSSPIEVELANEPQVQNKGAKYAGENIRKSAQLVDKNGEMNVQDICQYSEKGVKCRAASQKEGPGGKNLSCPIEVQLANEPQVQNRSTKYAEKMDLQNIRKSPRLSDKHHKMGLQNILESSESGIKCASESQNKDSNKNNMFSQIEGELANEPQIQNRSSKYDVEMDLQNIRKSSRLLEKNSKMDLQNILEIRESEIKRASESQSKDTIRNHSSLQIEGDLAKMPQIQKPSANNDACPVENAIASSQKFSKSVPYEYYVSSEKGINLIVDLNSSPSEWTKKRFEDVMSHSQNLQKFPSFRDEIECLGNSRAKSLLISSTDSVSKISTSHVENNASPSSLSRQNSHVQLDLPDGETKSFSDEGTGPDGLGNSTEETRSLVTGKAEASSFNSLLEKRPEFSVSAGSHKRKRKDGEIFGSLLRSGKRVGARRSMRLFFKV